MTVLQVVRTLFLGPRPRLSPPPPRPPPGLGHFDLDGIVPSLACILTKKHGVRGGKYRLKIPGNGISETLLNFKMSLDASALNSSD